MKIKKFLRWLPLAVVGNEMGQALQTRHKRRKGYVEAQKRSKQVNKPLLVIGDPDNGGMNSLLGKDYGPGDVTLDITGCPRLVEQGYTVIKGKLEDEIVTLKDNSFVIFLSCVLEYVDETKLNDIYYHLKRVSGNDLFIVTVPKYTIHAHLYFPALWTGEGGARSIIEYDANNDRLIRTPTLSH